MGNLQEPLLQSGSLSKKGRKKLTIETESLSYDPPTNRLRIQDHKEWQGRRHLYGYALTFEGRKENIHMTQCTFKVAAALAFNLLYVRYVYSPSNIFPLTIM